MKLGGYTREVTLSLSLVLAIVLAAWFFDRASRNSLRRLIGAEAPDVTYRSPEGGEQSLSQKRGRVVMLNFWASWCTPCLEEMPALRALENHFSSRGFLLLAFNIGETSEVRGQLRGLDLPRNLIFQVNRKHLQPYGIDKLPISVLIDRGGRIRKVYEGPRNWMNIEYIREIEELLN